MKKKYKSIKKYHNGLYEPTRPVPHLTHADCELCKTGLNES